MNSLRRVHAELCKASSTPRRPSAKGGGFSSLRLMPPTLVIWDLSFWDLRFENSWLKIWGMRFEIWGLRVQDWRFEIWGFWALWGLSVRIKVWRFEVWGFEVWGLSVFKDFQGLEGVLGGVLGSLLEGILGGSWRVEVGKREAGGGASWRPFQVFWGCFEAFWGVLGCFEAVFRGFQA